MKWEHTCSLEWMKTRQRYLCASDVRKLVPLTKTGRPRKITEEDFISVYASKLRMLTSDDCISVGAAARGHILEPYAISEFNDYASMRRWPIHLEHWDDIVVHVDDKSPLAFSPDAMNTMPRRMKTAALCTEVDADTIGEVKCYSAEKHIASLYTKKEMLEERWQIATAMAADRKIMHAYLIFYNPSLTNNNFGVFEWDRAQLSNEIAIVNEIGDAWCSFLLKACTMKPEALLCINKRALTEQQIIKSLIEKSRLNP